ncbi:hypothetical protein T439DRAFT_301071 [Meredithblackwellia eburnea MCA 4105]
MPRVSSYIPILAIAANVTAHMSPYMDSAYGIYGDYPPFMPIGPSWSFDDWWFRGAATRASPPANGAVSVLPAGGNFTMEIACNIAFTTMGGNPNNNVACPGNIGAYHSGDPSASTVDYNLLSGCALAIADVDDISKVTVDNLAVFSVQKECVWQRDTTFQIPARMPPCTGSKCICAWMWLANNGTGNYYQTPFDCSISGSPSDATPINMPLVDPVYCPDSTSDCASGAKRPIYFYNNDYSNVPWVSNYARAGYHQSWSFADGAQNDIFAPSSAVSSSSMSSSTAALMASTIATTSNVSYPFTNDIALSATAKASSVSSGQPASAAINGKLGGYLNVNGDDVGNDADEWSSNGEGVGAWLKLTWTKAVTVGLVVLYDRPNLNDHCKGGTLTFSDGTVVNFGAMNNDGTATPVNISSVTTTTLLWTCTQVSAWTSNVGLSEIQVFAATSAAASSSALPSSASSSALSSSASSSVAVSSSSAISSSAASSSAASSSVPSSSAPSSSAVSSSSSRPVVSFSSSSAVVSSSTAPSSSSSVQGSSSVVSSSKPASSSSATPKPSSSSSSASKASSTTKPFTTVSGTPLCKLASATKLITTVTQCAGNGKNCKATTSTQTITATACPTSSASSSAASSSSVAASTTGSVLRRGPLPRSTLVSRAKRDAAIARQEAARRALLWTKKVHNNGDM